MTSKRLMIGGAAGVLLGLLLLAAQSFAPGGGVTGVQAGNSSTADPTACQQDCEASSTPRTVRTHTPTSTPTEAASTSTPVPPTQPAPTNTTAPSSGNEGVNVRPPNTGTGGNSGSNVSVLLLVLGAISVVAGGSAVFAGVRKR